ncbi:MAG TPA: helix-turn-helix domain-containing protein [Nitrososphaerales archaeon]|nr:helix-turn-helix domain-containing protein [Nitrososphaerales archaeon]
MYEISYRFQHDCPFNDFSRKFPTARVTIWDNFEREFMDVRSLDRKDWPRINKELASLARSKGSKILHKASDGRGYHLQIMTCACERKGSTPDLMMKSDCLFVPPITYYRGWETYHMIAFDRKGVKRLLAKFGSKGKVELLTSKRIDLGSIHRPPVMPLFDPLSGLTPMQLNALVTSITFGYYSQPRRTSTGKIASILKVPRTTFQEHRKKAESKLMAALTPYVLTYGGEPAKRP